MFFFYLRFLIKNQALIPTFKKPTKLNINHPLNLEDYFEILKIVFAYINNMFNI
jgi:hypothetical protein